MSVWTKQAKRFPQLNWPHQLSTSPPSLCLNLEYAEFWSCFQGGFHWPCRARGGIKDWWELSESVYCSRDPCMCYEWEDCVAVLPHRSSQAWHSVWQSRLDCLFFFFFWDYRRAVSRQPDILMWNMMKCLLYQAFIFPQPHEFCSTLKAIGATLTHYCR